MTGLQGVGLGLLVGLGVGVPLGKSWVPLARSWRKARRHMRIARHQTGQAAGWLAIAALILGGVVYLLVIRGGS